MQYREIIAYASDSRIKHITTPWEDIVVFFSVKPDGT
jgi:hypothetical protein